MLYSEPCPLSKKRTRVWRIILVKTDFESKHEQKIISVHWRIHKLTLLGDLPLMTESLIKWTFCISNWKSACSTILQTVIIMLSQHFIKWNTLCGHIKSNYQTISLCEIWHWGVDAARRWWAIQSADCVLSSWSISNRHLHCMEAVTFSQIVQ
jgi:hypothetical protein